MTKKNSNILKSKKFTLTGLVHFLNGEKKEDGTLRFQTKNNKPITIGDVQGYVRRKKLPNYMGGFLIKEVASDIIGGTPLYCLEEL